MPQSYFLTENGLKIRNCLNPECCEYVQFHSVNPVAQALRDFIVSGPGLIPGITAAALVMQARTYANTPVPEAFYYPESRLTQPLNPQIRGAKVR